MALAGVPVGARGALAEGLARLAGGTRGEGEARAEQPAGGLGFPWRGAGMTSPYCPAALLPCCQVLLRRMHRMYREHGGTRSSFTAHCVFSFRVPSSLLPSLSLFLPGSFTLPFAFSFFTFYRSCAPFSPPTSSFSLYLRQPSPFTRLLCSRWIRFINLDPPL